MAKIYSKDIFETFAKETLEFVLYDEYHGKLKEGTHDKPDFQTIDNTVGIEFTLIGGKLFFHASGIYDENIYESKDTQKVEKYEEKMEKCGWQIDEQGFCTKPWDSIDVVEWIKESFTNKVRELQNYSFFDEYRLLMWGVQSLPDYNNPELLTVLLSYFLDNNYLDRKYSVVYYFSFKYFITFDLKAKLYLITEFSASEQEVIANFYKKAKYNYELLSSKNGK